MQVEEESPKQYVDIARAPDKEMRPQRPVPLGLRPGRSSASLPGLTISTYGLRRAPRIRSALATTHHAPIIDIGSRYRVPGTASQRLVSDTASQIGRLRWGVLTTFHLGRITWDALSATHLLGRSGTPAGRAVRR